MQLTIDCLFSDLKINEALSFLLEKFKASTKASISIEDVTMEENEDGQAFTYAPAKDCTDILVEIYKCEDVELALAHELVHVAQIIANKPLCENEAYGLEDQIKDILCN